MLGDILNKNKLSAEDLFFLLCLQDEKDIKQLFKHAYQVKKKERGQIVYFRGLVELSNICSKDCYYCGIRKSNKKVKRYSIGREEIISSYKWAYEQGYGSVVLQAGENSSPAYVDFIAGLLEEITALSKGRLGITISLGEQNKDVYRLWKEAGAHRYLLRIETSNRDLYQNLHPKNHSFTNRVRCLDYLRELNYKVGTGIMIGLPGQSIHDLVNDILFFEKIKIDMIGMGPYIPHADTPLPIKTNQRDNGETVKNNFLLALKMIACVRIYFKNINIAATTALQAIEEDGREQGLLAGANIIMPNITSTNYRQGYQLYNDKPGIDENASLYNEGLCARIAAIGEKIGYNRRGDLNF
jgi:biotin synthase